MRGQDASSTVVIVSDSDDDKGERELLSLIPRMQQHSKRIPFSVLNDPNIEKLIKAANHNTQLETSDEQFLGRNSKLNDNIVDWYLDLVRERDRATKLGSEGANHNREPTKQDLVILHSKVITKFKEVHAHSKKEERDSLTTQFVSKWFGKRNVLLGRDTIIIPIHQEEKICEHWSVVQLKVPQKAIVYYCSSGGGPQEKECRRLLPIFVKALSEIDDRFDGHWTFLRQASIPQQIDDHSCGLYAVVFADLLAAGSGFTSFNDTQIQALRQALRIIVKANARS